MARKCANPGENDGQLPLRTAGSKSLAVSLADCEQPYRFLQQGKGSLKIDDLAARTCAHGFAETRAAQGLQRAHPE